MSLGRHKPFDWWRCLIPAVALTVFLPVHAGASSFCIEVEQNGFLWRSMRAALGGEFVLSFPHSIYGSRVEEVFRLRSDGFQLIELRYAEHRLVEFYGYESAEYRNTMWIVRPKPALISSLHLSASSDARLLLSFASDSVPMQLTVTGDAAFRLTPAVCKDTRDD